MKRRRNRKTKAVQSPPRKASSAKLAAAQVLFQTGDTSQALRNLNRLAREVSTSEEKSKIAGMAADSQKWEGRFADAGTLFEKLSDQTPTSNRSWLRADMGRLRCHLDSGEHELAISVGQSMMQRAEKAIQLFQSAEEVAKKASLQGRQASIPERPHRVSVVAQRIGTQFSQAGFPDTADFFFNLALESNPDGASRARLGKAKIAFQEGRYQDASKLAEQSIKVGNFKSKTVVCWRLYLKATLAAGAQVPLSVLTGLLNQYTSTVRARATLEVVIALRSGNQDAWRSVAEAWLEANTNRRTNTAIQAELTKLLLADARTRPGTNPLELGNRARKVLQTPGLRYEEWLFAAKSSAESEWRAGDSDALARMLTQGLSLFKPETHGQMRHSFAKLAFLLGIDALAVEWLQTNIDTLGADTPERGKAFTLLAEHFEKQKNYPSAARLYQQLWTENRGAPRHLMGAFLSWSRMVYSHDQSDSSAMAQQPKFEAQIANITDYVLALDIARQMILCPPWLKDIQAVCLAKGITLAQIELKSSKAPARQRRILFLLTRRLHDFLKFSDIISLWENLDASTREQLWSEHEEFWEYVTYVFRAYERTNQTVEGRRLAESYLNDPATPPVGIAHLGIAQALRYTTENQWPLAFQIFEWVISQAPTHPRTGYAHFWMSLRSLKRNQADEAKTSASRIIACTGERPDWSWKRHLYLQALLIQDQFNVNVVHDRLDAWISIEEVIENQMLLKLNLDRLSIE